jgi:hypothetical protein
MIKPCLYVLVFIVHFIIDLIPSRLSDKHKKALPFGKAFTSSILIFLDIMHVINYSILIKTYFFLIIDVQFK